MDMLGLCVDCGETTAEYVITAEMLYSICDHCYSVQVIQIAGAAA